MNTSRTLIDELEGAFANKEIGQRAKVLQLVTDLFVTNSNSISTEQTALFDDVMMRLFKELNDTAREAFGQRCSEMATVPPGIVRELVLDDSIEVAGAMLRRFEHIGEDILLQTAMTKSQEHLLAISQRHSISESVTDILVERGNEEVAVSTAENPGARFSEFGYATLVKRADADRELAVRIWKRREIPRQHLLALFATASQAVQGELQSIDPGKAADVVLMIGRARDEFQNRARERSAEYIAARLRVESMRDSGQLSESDVLAFARAGKFDETSVALSLMGDVPIGLVETAMTHVRCDQLLVLAKSIGLSFETVRAIVSIRARENANPGIDIKQAAMSYEKLRPETARKAIQYYRLRERAVLN